MIYHAETAVLISSEYPAEQIAHVSGEPFRLKHINGTAATDQALLVRFSGWADSVKYRPIYWAHFSVFGKMESEWPENYIFVRPLNNSIPYKPTWNNAAGRISDSYSIGKSAHIVGDGVYHTIGNIPISFDRSGYDLSRATHDALIYGICLSLTEGEKSNPGLMDLGWDISDISIDVDFGSTDLSFRISLSYPSIIYSNPRKAYEFSWSIYKDSQNYCLGTFYQESAVFHWRQGESGDYTDVPSTGSGSSTTRKVTIPANTFAPGKVQVYVTVTGSNGETKDSSVVTINTEDAITTITDASPGNGSWQNKDEIIPFHCVYKNSFNNSATGFDIEYSTDQVSWDRIEVKNYSGPTYRDLYYDMPANALPSSLIYWRARVYNLDGVAGPWSDIYQFTTLDTPSVATALSPNGTVEDTDGDVAFQWSVSNTSGTESTGADLQYSYDGNSWINLGHTDGERILVIHGGTIHAGTIQWRVRSYNRDAIAGPWSSPVTFVARAAPRVLEVLANGKPFTMFTWQATDQQTYEIEVDGIKYGSFFGTEKAFRLPNYLEDGTHTVKVRVQNAMNIWSNPVELTFSVLNVPGESLHLSGDFDLDAELFWNDESESSDYLVYRDGKLIGETTQRAFTDRVILGEHTYYVIHRFSSGYYSKSNEVECTLSTDMTQIALLSGGEWMPLEKSENTRRTQRFTHSRNVAYHHFSGDKNPTPEVSDEEDLVGEFDAAWFYTEEGTKKLKSLLGQALIIKSRGEEVVIGVLEAYTKVNRKHFQGYAFNIHQMEWKDYICVE